MAKGTLEAQRDEGSPFKACWENTPGPRDSCVVPVIPVHIGRVRGGGAPGEAERMCSVASESQNWVFTVGGPSGGAVLRPAPVPQRPHLEGLMGLLWEGPAPSPPAPSTHPIPHRLGTTSSRSAVHSMECEANLPSPLAHLGFL